MTPDDYAAIPCTQLDKSLYPPLDEEAERWFREAYELETPKGVKIDFKRVAKLYQKAVDKGHYKAMNNLSILYLRGLGVEQSEQKSVELDLMMAALNIPEGHMAVGLSTDQGRGGLTGGREKALEYYAIAARQGHPKAQTIIGRYLLDHAKRKEAGKRLLYCALEQGYGDAAYELAVEYEVIDKDNARAIHYYREGAKLGQQNCINQLSKAYRKGKLGLNIDEERGLCIYRLHDQFVAGVNPTFPDLDERCPGMVDQPY